MKYNPAVHNRHTVRIKDYDYAQAGLYFVTICTQDRENLFGEIVDDEMRLNEIGEIAATCWNNLPRTFPNLILDQWVIMPNHLHGILCLEDTRPEHRKVEASQRPNGTTAGSINAMIQNFKSIGARKINAHRGTAGAPVWQRNYWEHIIRNEKSYTRIATYIINNPLTWEKDELNCVLKL